MTETDAIAKVYIQFTKLNPTLINCVNKKATTMDTFREDVYAWMNDNGIPNEFRDAAYSALCDSAWNYDILKPFIYDDGAISDIACHSWDNVWIQTRGKWSESPVHFRNQEHYDRFFQHVLNMHNITLNERNQDANCTDIDTCPDFRMRLNFLHKSVITDGTNVFSIRKIPTHKKTLDILCRPEEGMIKPSMIPIIKQHLQEATGIFIVGMGGSGKTTFLNAIIEELPLEWKYLFVQENEELYTYTHRNVDFIKTVRPMNEYDVSYDLQKASRNGLLMSIRCFVIGETKGAEALYLFNVMNTGALGITTLHSSSSARGLDKAADYIKYASDYSKDECMDMLTLANKVFFLQDYRLREISTIHGYNSSTHKLDLTTEYYDPDNMTE